MDYEDSFKFKTLLLWFVKLHKFLKACVILILSCNRPYILILVNAGNVKYSKILLTTISIVEI